MIHREFSFRSAARRPFRARGRKSQNVHGRFLRLDNFWLQNCAIQRTAARITLLRAALGKQATQRCENLRKNSLLNYKSAALPTELCRHFAGGNATFSSNFRPHCIRNFLWDASWRHEHGAKSKTKLRTSSPMCFAEHRRTTCCTNCIRCDGFVGSLLWQL
jgi:hypothetical protein